MNKEILRIALPAIISNITTPLLGLADTAITGHLGAAVYMSAIAVGGTMFSMVYWLMNFLRLGTSGLTSQAYGAGDYECTLRILRRGLVTALILSAAMIALHVPLSGLLLSIIEADADTTSMAATYFGIVIFGAPAVLSTYVLTGWMLGMQNSRLPMYMALVTNVVNILISLALVYGAGMKIEGVAIGTVVAQWAGVITGAVMMRSIMRRGGTACAHELSLVKYLRMNIDIMLRTLCLVGVTVWFTRIGASMGQAVLAANAILMQLFILFSYFMDGFAFAGEAIAGKYYGAKDWSSLNGAVRGILRWGLWVTALFTVVYLIAGQWIVDILTDDYDVRQSASAYLVWVIFVPAAGVLAFVWDGVFIGLVWMRRMLVTMIAAVGVFFVSQAVLTSHYGNHGLWLAFILYLFTRGAVQTLIYLRHRG